MAWQQLKISVKAEHAEAVGDMLSANGAQAVTFVDAKDTPMYEPKPGEVFFWPDTEVVGLYDAELDLQTIITRISKAKIFQHEFTHKVDQLEDKDWETAWMDNWQAMQFGERLWIVPSWTEIPDENAVNVVLDPGLAFGTGTHPTTSLCLKWLDSGSLDAKEVIDFGCGSGILAVAALKLGASRAHCIDIDNQALLSTRNNASKNKVEHLISLYQAPNQPLFTADVVLANILAGPLKSLSDVISSHCKENGYLIMSGILENQAEEVMSFYNHMFSFDTPLIEGEWAMLVGRKNKA